MSSNTSSEAVKAPSTPYKSGANILRPPFDPEIKPIVDKFLEFWPQTLDVDWLRKNTPLQSAEDILGKYPGFRHTQHTVPGLNKHDPSIIVSVFQPESPKAPTIPALYFVHGGGQISGNRYSDVDHMISYFDGADAVFVTVEYRLAPDRRPPAAVHDCYAGLLWLADNATRFGVNKSKIMICGGSGGAPLTVGTTVMCRDNRKAFPCAAMILTPMLDDRLTTVSARQFENGTVWPSKDIRGAWQYVLGDAQGQTDVEPLSAPGRLEDFVGFPPTFVDAGACEVFRDEAVAFASRLWKCGVSAELHIWPGAFHGFDVLSPKAAVSRDAIAAKIGWIKRVLQRPHDEESVL